ncbi:26S protease regulatory subunit 7 [Capsicum chinense]|nr:26S protease regulatory subunit 7 [Capsicum chinense]
MYGGPVQYHWMYKIERFLFKLKRYVRNKARPEGSIAKDYIIDECLTFCSMYLDDIDTRFNHKYRNDDGSSNNNKPILDIFSKNIRPYKDGDYDAIPKKDFDMAQWYVLNNCEEAESFLEKHKEELLKQGVMDIEEKHREQFFLWFRRKIMQLFSKEKSRSIMKVYSLGIKKSDTGLAALSQWDIASDKQIIQEEQPLQVARCTKIISPNIEDAKYVINVKKIAKPGVCAIWFSLIFWVNDVTYNDVIGYVKRKLRRCERLLSFPFFTLKNLSNLELIPPKGVLCYGPPGTGKILLARAVANRTDGCFICILGSEHV